MKKIILSRTDNLGDVILTLPMAGVLKKFIPDCKIYFLGKSYTRPLIEACSFVDEFLDWDERISQKSKVKSQKSSIRHPVSSINFLSDIMPDAIIHVFPNKEIARLAKQAGIPVRIGTSHRWYHWLYCTKLLHFTRKNSDLHEAQLNLKMLKPLGIKQTFRLEDIPGYYGFHPHPYPLPRGEAKQRMDQNHPSRLGRLILHPKSKGSAREWGLDNFSRLIALLPADRFSIFITGTKEEGTRMKDFLDKNKDRVTDLTGKLTLAELISFIDSCDAIVAASTGPLHIAAALGKFTLGLYAPMKPIYPKRWAPLGKNAHYLCTDKPGCTDCKNSSECHCLKEITPEEVAERLLKSEV